MALLQTITLEHLPANYTLHVAVYRDIKNASFLQQQLLAGNSDFEYAFIDATVVCIWGAFRSRSRGIRPRTLFTKLAIFEINVFFIYHILTFFQIVSELQVLSAAYRAVNDLIEDRLKSRNVHSEIVFSLSPNNNVCFLLSCQIFLAFTIFSRLVVVSKQT